MNGAVDLYTARTLAANERWFELLGISPYASEEDTKRACRAARVSTHPDRGHDQLELAQIVNHAADQVLGLVAKPFALYETHVDSEVPQWALDFEVVLASDRQQRNWEAFEHHLELYRRRVEQTVVERDRAREEAARQERLRLAEAQASKKARAAFLRRLGRGFATNVRNVASKELALARAERRRLLDAQRHRKYATEVNDKLAELDARIKAAVAEARSGFDEERRVETTQRFPKTSPAFTAAFPTAASQLRILHKRYKVLRNTRSRPARPDEIADILRRAWGIFHSPNDSADEPVD